MFRSVPGSLKALVFLGLFSSAGCSTPVEKLWEFPTTSPLYSTPLVLDSLIVFGSEAGTLHAVDRQGKARWRYAVPSGEIFARPVTDGELIFFGATNQSFYAVDMSGRLRWQFSAKERIKSDPTVSEGVVYATSYDGHIYALRADSGQLLWQFPPAQQKTAAKPAGDAAAGAAGEAAPDAPTEEPIIPQAFSYAAPCVKDGVLYVGNLDGYMYAINTADGSLKWRYKTGGGITSSALVEDGALFFGSKDDQIYALELSGDKLRWKFGTGGDVLSSPRIQDGVLYIGSSDKNFYALDAKTGQVKCKLETQGEVISFSAFYADLVFFNGGQGDGNIYAMERGTCKPFFRFKTGYKIESDPVIAGDKLYVTSGDHKLYAFRINKPTAP